MKENITVYTGERYMPDMPFSEISYEHWARYLFAEQFVTNKVVLDIACGEGYGLNFISDKTKKAMGIDINLQVLEDAKKKYGDTKLDFLVANANSIPLGNSFDLISSFETIEHLNRMDQHAFLDCVITLLKKDGIFLVSTPDKNVYSDLPDFNNQFHIDGFYFSDFEKFLKNYFKHITFFGQINTVGSLIKNKAKGTQNISLHQIEHLPQGFVISKNEPEYRYYIAVCSNKKIQALNSSFTIDVSNKMIDDLISSGKKFIHEKNHFQKLYLEGIKELNDMKSSKSWKTYSFFLKIRKNIFPPRIKAESFIRRIFSTIENLILSQKYKQDITLIQNSGLFDPNWYLAKYPDAGEVKIDPAIHYLLYGGFDGKNPSPKFNSESYYAQYQDVRIAKMNPLLHYLKYGQGEGREISFGYTSPEYAFDTISSFSADFDSSIQYQKYFESIDNKQSKFYREFQKHKTDNHNLIAKLIAFYLPQFHPIPENDACWGKGFTEWTNVSKALPNYIGHYQPHLPGELGFYDLRVEEVQERQIELAKNYGVYGFCFHYYWFDGKRLLEKPLNQFLKNKDNAFPFCVCWANENWTRRWDGAENDIFIQQNYSIKGNRELISSIIDLSRDARYIRVCGKPLFIVYRVDLIPQVKKVAEIWREEFQKNTSEDVFLVAAQSFTIDDPRDYGFDAAVEFPPHRVFIPHINLNTIPMANPSFNGKVLDYEMAMKFILQRKIPEYKFFRTVMPAWDNTPRKQNNSHIFINSNPESYQHWLSSAIKWTQKYLAVDEQFIFVNAWNEWGEGAYLEPDRKYGYAYLQATYDALRRI